MEKLILTYAAKLTRYAKVGGYLLLFSFFALPGILFAQSDTSKKLKEVKILISQVPLVQNITPSQQILRTDLERYSALTVADAIRDFAGVNIKDYGGIGGLKTVSVRSLGANHLAVLYDGVRLSDAQSGQIDLGKLNINNIQSIILYNGQPPQICMPARSFASASVLAMTTTRPKLDSVKPYQIGLGINTGSFGLVNPYLQWQQRISKQWCFVVNSYLEKANGKYKYKVDGDGSDTLATRINGDVDTKQADAALYWAKSDSNKLSIHFNYYNSNRGLPGAVIFYNPYSASRLQDRDYFIQAGYERLWKNGLQLLINSKYSQSYQRYTDPTYLNGAGGLDQEYTLREFYQSAALAYRINPNWELSYATDAAYAKLDANVLHYLYPNRFTLYNVLASNLKAGKWFFEGNVLFTYINDRVNSGDVAKPVSVLSPTLVVNYRVNKNLQLRTFYKDIFRAPTFDEQYFFAAIQTRSLKPEYAKQLDVGLSYSKGLNGLFNYVAFTVDGYFNRVTNKIIVLPNQNLVISSILNLGRVDIAGADFGLKTEMELSEKCKALINATYTYQQGLYIVNGQESTRIPYTPQHAVAINAGVFNSYWGLYFNQVYSTSRYYLIDNSPEYKIPGFGVADVNGIRKFSINHMPVSISAGVNNIFNVNYSIVRSFPMPGRSFKLSMQVTI